MMAHLDRQWIRIMLMIYRLSTTHALRGNFIDDICQRTKKISGKGKQQLFDSLSLLGTINDLLDQWLVDWTPGWMLQGQAEARIIVIVLWDSQYPYNYG